MPARLPTIVLVHGAWHTPANYLPFTRALEDKGFEVHIPQLATCSNQRPSTATFADDVAVVRQTVEPLITQSSRRVLVVMHSYGGKVGTEAIQDLSLTRRKAGGLEGGVIHLLYMCAFMLPVGGSMNQVVEEAGFTDLLPKMLEISHDGSCFPVDPIQGFFADLPEEEAEKQVSLLVRFRMEPFAAQTSYAAWKEIASTYIFTSEDNGVPPIYQKIMTDRAKQSQISLTEKHYAGSHSPYLTKTADMVREVEEACTRALGE